MRKLHRSKKIFLASLLLLIMVVFNFHIFIVLAEDENPETPPAEETQEIPPTECTFGQNQSCDTGLLGICSAGTQTCTEEGMWDSCVQTDQPAAEDCTNGLDNDCNGLIDSTEPACQIIPPAGNKCGNSLIETGNSNVVVGVINITNSNITNSDFTQLLYNIFNKQEGDIDISDQIASSEQENCQNCLEVTNQNQGSIENNILIDALTGGNSAESKNGDAIIKTGNANVSASIFNLLNTNVISSNWTQLIINVFDDWTGDLLFPGKEAMEEFLNRQSSFCENGCPGNDYNIYNSNQGIIENNVQVEANTGDNTAEGSSSIIRTGRAIAQTNVVNIANTNLTNQNLFFVAVNNFGNWQGNIFSLPPGLEAALGLNGVEIYNIDSDGILDPSNSFPNKVANENIGKIRNSVVVNVSTGGNSARSRNGKANIQTGNANVATNLVNILNSNVIGNNFLLGMINNFGNWQGNIAFGRPDLWVGENAVIPNSASAAVPNETITYTLTYRNNGNADATGVTLFDNFDERYLNISNTGGGVIVSNPGEIKWDIGTVPVGGSGQVTYTATVSDRINYGSTYVDNQSAINAIEPDQNSEDNNDNLTVQLYKMPPRVYEPSYSFFHKANLVVKKVNNLKDVLEAPGTIDYTITLNNSSYSSAYNVIIKDVLRYKDSDEAIKTYQWDLGEVFPQEEIKIDYTVKIDGSIVPGFYTNTAQATGLDEGNAEIKSNEASTTIEIKVNEAENPFNLEDIAYRLKLVADAIQLIGIEIERMLPKKENEQGIIEQIQEIVIPVVSAQELEEVTEKPEETKSILDKLLASLSSFLTRSFKGIPLVTGLFLSLFLITAVLDNKRNGNGNGNGSGNGNHNGKVDGNGRKKHRKSNWFKRFIHSFFSFFA